MFSRVFVAACAVGVAVGALIAPVESVARGGAGSAGHFGGFRPFAVRHFHNVHPVFPHVKPAPPLASSSGAVVRIRANPRAAFLRHHRGFFGFGLPYTYGSGGPFYGSYYDPADVVGSLDQPPVADPSADTGPSAGCRSQTVTVPSSNGGERDVTVIRC